MTRAGAHRLIDGTVVVARLVRNALVQSVHVDAGVPATMARACVGAVEHVLH